MNYKMMGRFLGQILFIEALLMIPALGISLFCGDPMAVRGFLVAIAVAAVIAAILHLSCKGAPTAFYAKEGFVCVAGSWVVLSLVGCLPFWLSGEIPHFVSGYFLKSSALPPRSPVSALWSMTTLPFTIT